MLISRHRIGVSTEVRRQQLSARQRFGTGPDKPSSSSAQSSLFELIRGISADFNVYSAFQSMSRSTRISVFSKRHQKQARLVRLRDYRCLHFRLEMNQLAKESIWALSGVSTHPHTHTLWQSFILSSWGIIRNSGVFRELGFEKLIPSEREIKWVVVTITP